MPIIKGNVLSTWNGFERGDAVKVSGHRGKFTFYSVRLDENNEPLWITVVGGTWQHSKFRHFPPFLVTPTKKEKA